jgi:hypothetical protein
LFLACQVRDAKSAVNYLRGKSLERLVQFHTGYKPDENDYRDVRALCDHFGIAPPQEYLRFADTL